MAFNCCYKLKKVTLPPNLKKIEYEASLLRKNIIMFKRKLRSNLEEQLKMVDDIEVIEELE